MYISSEFLKVFGRFALSGCPARLDGFQTYDPLVRADEHNVSAFTWIEERANRRPLLSYDASPYSCHGHCSGLLFISSTPPPTWV